MRTALAALACIVLACLLAPVYARHVAGADPFRTGVLAQAHGQDVLAEDPSGLGVTPIGPGWRGAYLLGADGLGRDVAARLLYGGRASLAIAGGATLLSLAVALLAGGGAGFFGGATDAVLGGLIDLLWAFPVYLLAICLAAVLAADELDRLWLPAVIIGLVYVPYVARPLRAEVAALRGRDFVEAAIACGGSRLHILRRHILPNLWPLLLSLAPVVAALALLTEAALSVLGIGVQAPAASWGTLIADGRVLMYTRPLVAIAPGLAVVATVLALNGLAEALRGD